MPELPEVEIVRRGLEKIFHVDRRAGAATVEKLELKRWDLRSPIPRNLPKLIRNQTITRVRRRAKYLLIEFEKGALLSHLGMTGSWRLCPPGDEQLHDHVYLHLADGRRLAYRDPRRFGVLDWVDASGESKWLDHLGPEPLDANAFTAQVLWEKLHRRKTLVKVALMAQEVVVGVGNIYASEALFRAGIRPTKLAHRMTKLESARLVEAIRAVLTEAILAGGSSIRDYVQASGESGGFQERFAVYDRNGEPCRQCSTPIRHAVHAGRSTYWCIKCQH